MAKRFTSTEKWDDPWFRRLSFKSKLFWDFICCNADNAGIWKIDWELASFKIGHEIDVSILEEINTGKERLKIFNDELMIILGFIPYQIGNLNHEKLTNLQKSCMSLINKYVNEKKIPKEYLSLTGSLPVAYGYKHKGKGKGKGKEDRIVKERNQFKPPTLEEVQSYCQERGNTVDSQHFIDFYASKGWMVGKNKMIDWKAALRRSEKWELFNKPKPIIHKPASVLNEMEKWEKQQKEEENAIN